MTMCYSRWSAFITALNEYLVQIEKKNNIVCCISATFADLHITSIDLRITYSSKWIQLFNALMNTGTRIQNIHESRAKLLASHIVFAKIKIFERFILYLQ